MPRYKSKSYCEGEKMNPAIPGQTLSVCMPLSLKREIVKQAHSEKKSIAAWVREILKREMASC